MHIAFLNPQGNFDALDTGWTLHPDFGGQLVYVKEIAQAMGQKGHKVDILTRMMQDSNWTQFADPLDKYNDSPNVRIVRIPCGPKKFLNKEQLWPFLPEWTDNILTFYQADNREPDFYTTHYADGGLSGVMIKNKTGTPFSFTGHSLGAQKMDKFIANETEFESVVHKFNFGKRIAAERLSMKYSDLLFTSTLLEKDNQYAHNLYQNAISVSDPKFSIVPPGVNLKIFNSVENEATDKIIIDRIKSMLDRDISLERRQLPMVICSSRLDRKKNHLDLVKAWAVNPDLKNVANLLIIVRGTDNPLKEGEKVFSGEEKDIFREIMSVIDNHDLQGCVSGFDLNSQQELAACYRYLAREQQGIFALTARYEPFGLAPLEAIACGLPVVVTKNGGPSESLRDDKRSYGVLVDPQDPKDIASGILKLIDKEFWKSTQIAGRNRVRDKYTWEQTAHGYLDAIKTVLSRNHFTALQEDDIDSEVNIDLNKFKKEYFQNK